MSIYTARPTLTSGDPVGSTTQLDKYYYFPVGTLSSITSDVGNLVDSIDYKETQGWDLKGYRERKERGELLPFSPFTQFEVKGTASGVKDIYYPGNSRNHWRPNPIHNSAWVLNDTELHEAAARISAEPYVQAAASAIYSQGWDALTFAAELHHVVRLFRNALERIITYRKSDSLENIWLEGRYGWRILVFDIIEISKLMSRINSKRRERYKERQGTSYSYTNIETIEQTFTPATVDWRVETSYSISCRGTVVADILVPQIAINPITTAWELVTLSFVVDWFLSVGQTLEALSFATLASRYEAGGGHLVTATRSFSRSNISIVSGYEGTNIDQDATCEASLTLRSPTRVPFTPSFVQKLNAFKVLDLVALFFQRLK